MKKPVLAALLLLLASHAIASPDTLRLYYPINVHQLADQDKLKIKTIIDSIAKDQPVTIRGYADYLGNKPYNQALSQLRANTIRAYIISLDDKIKISAEGEGQVPGTGQPTAFGEPRDRRVDIIYSKIVRVKEAAPAEPVMTNFGKKIDSLSSLDVSKGISLDELTFEGGRHVLMSVSEPYLRFLTKYLAEHKNLYFEVRGHVCCEPKSKMIGGYKNGKYVLTKVIADGYDFDEHDDQLSVNRAHAIYSYFAQNGIGTARMTYTGVGGSQPKIDPELTETDRQRNRRVEIVILKK